MLEPISKYVYVPVYFADGDEEDMRLAEIANADIPVIKQLSIVPLEGAFVHPLRDTDDNHATRVHCANGMELTVDMKFNDFLKKYYEVK